MGLFEEFVGEEEAQKIEKDAEEVKRLEKTEREESGNERSVPREKRQKPSESYEESKKDWASISSLVLGVISIFLWEFSIIPILAIGFGVSGLSTEKKRGVAVTGLILGVIFLIVRILQG